MAAAAAAGAAAGPGPKPQAGVPPLRCSPAGNSPGPFCTKSAGGWARFADERACRPLATLLHKPVWRTCRSWVSPLQIMGWSGPFSCPCYQSVGPCARHTCRRCSRPRRLWHAQCPQRGPSLSSQGVHAGNLLMPVLAVQTVRRQATARGLFSAPCVEFVSVPSEQVSALHLGFQMPFEPRTTCFY